VLAAPPNVGKLSLFNVLARREAAIVSAIPGTIRDVTEVTSLGTRKPRYCGGRGFHGLRVRLGRWWSPAPGSTIGRSEDQANHNLGSGQANAHRAKPLPILAREREVEQAQGIAPHAGTPRSG
jgi:50S ribosome-binding GTPase